MQSLTSTQYSDMDAPLRAILAARYNNVHPSEIDLQLEVSAFSGEWVVVRVDNDQVERLKIADAKALLATSPTAEKKNQMRDPLVIALTITLGEMLEQKTHISSQDASLVVGLLMRTTFWHTIVLAVQSEQEVGPEETAPDWYWWTDEEAEIRSAESGERDEWRGHDSRPSDRSIFDPNNPSPFSR